MPTITIRELAALCGVAVSTVSRAMNGHPEVSEETRRRVLTMAKKYNYIANSSARSLKVHSTNVIAVLMQGELSPIFLPMISMFNEEFKEAGFSLMLTFIPDDQAEPGTVARIVRDRKISGVVFLGRYGGEGKGALSSQRLAEMGTPLVFCTTGDFSGTGAVHSSVAVDDTEGCRMATRHLLQAGHRRIVCVGAGDPGDAEQVWATRIDGFRKAVMECGEPVYSPVLHSAVPQRLYTMENGYETMKRALDDGLDVTGVVAICDAVAVGVGKALVERGMRVPDDVSIVGFDDIDIAKYLSPGLTTIAQPLREIVHETTRVLLGTIRNPDAVAERVRIPGTLQIRGSVATPAVSHLHR